MNDPTPNNANRIAFGVGQIFHPFVVSIVTLLIVLSDMPLLQALAWTAFIGVVLIGPLILAIAWLKRRETYTYHRHSRGTLYLVGWISIVICLTATIVFDAPTVLKACMGALLLWIPLQALVNARITKVSAHVAVMTACTLGVVWIEAWRDPAVWILGMGIVALVAWARITTRNHSLLQVSLGVLTGALPVLVVFSAVL